MSRFHIIIGLCTVAAFIGTGVYLELALQPIIERDPALRFTHRANHIYLLMSGLLNIAVGTYWRPHPKAWRRKMQTMASIALGVAPAVLLAAFIFEAQHDSPIRPITAAGALLCFLGVMLNLFGRQKRAAVN